MSNEAKQINSWDELMTMANEAVTVPNTAIATDAEVEQILGVKPEEVEEQSEVAEKQPEVVEKQPDPEQPLDINKLLEEYGLIVEGKSLKAKVKVSGEEKIYDVKDLKKDKSGEVHWDKKFSELDKERQAFLKEKKPVEDYINNFTKIANEKNELEAVKYLASLVGKPAHLVVDNIIKTLAPEIQRRQGLNEYELQLEKREAEARHREEQAEFKSKQFQAEEANKALEMNIAEIKATKNLSEDDWAEAVRELDAKLPKSQEIYPETVSEYVDFKRGLKADKHLAVFNGGQLAQNNEVREELVKIISDMPYLKDNEIQDILSEAFKIKETQEVQQKLEKKASKPKQQSKQEEMIKPLTSWNDY